jgi:Mg-chelatase subunit ChlD
VEEAKELAARLKDLKIASLILDTEAGFLNLSCLPELADKLGAKYYKIQELQAPEVVARVEDLIKFNPA